MVHRPHRLVQRVRPYRLRGARWRRGPVLMTFGRRRLVYGGRWPFAALALALAVAAVLTGTLTGRSVIAWSALAVVAAWVLYALRIQRPVPAGRGRGRGWSGPGPGAGVREPLRPLPKSPAGAAELPLSGS